MSLRQALVPLLAGTLWAVWPAALLSAPQQPAAPPASASKAQNKAKKSTPQPTANLTIRKKNSAKKGTGSTSHRAAALPSQAAPSRKPASNPRLVRAASRRLIITESMRSAAAQAVLESMTPFDEAIEQPGALVPFFEQLYRLKEMGQNADHPVHILHYGDSHSATDDWAQAIRSGLQAEFGDGGPGFVHAGRPFRGWRRWDTESQQSGFWQTLGLVGQNGDGLYGMSGLAITSASQNASISLTTSAQHVELMFLQQPDGGDFQISANGQPPERLKSDGELAPAVYSFAPSPGESQQYLVRTAGGGQVRLLGWAADNPRGVTYETMGINGAALTLQSAWDAGLQQAELARRKPALIVLAYGTNEALWNTFDAAAYQTALTSLITRYRQAAPQASILLVGPLDAWRRTRYGFRPFPHLDEVIAVQRTVARDNGCAFWDWRRHMGGPGSMSTWAMAGYAQGDHTHLTKLGYDLLGKTMLDELILNYKKFVTLRSESSHERTDPEPAH